MKTEGSWGKFELYIVSLWFLFLLMIVVTVDVPLCYPFNECQFIGFEELLLRNIVPTIALFFVILGIFFYYRFDYKLSGSKKIPSKIVSIEDANYEHLTFLTTYIIPLICFNLTSTRYLLALGFLLVIIGIIYVKTDKFYANPTLAVLGFRLYQVELSTRTGTKSNIILITKDRLSHSDQITSLSLDKKVYFARKLT